MIIDILKSFNWIDFIAVILLFRILYISVNLGSLVEGFKVLGVVSGTILALENFNVVAGFITGYISLPIGIVNSVSFIALAFFGYFICLVLRDLVLKFVKRKEKKLLLLDRLVALCLGLVRFALVFSLILLGLRLSGFENFYNDTKNSYFAPYFVNLAPLAHKFIISSLVAKALPSIEPNQAIEAVFK